MRWSANVYLCESDDNVRDGDGHDYNDDNGIKREIEYIYLGYFSQKQNQKK